MPIFCLIADEVYPDQPILPSGFVYNNNEIVTCSFYKFCEGILIAHPEYFTHPLTELLSTLEQTGLLVQLIDGFPADHPLKRFRGDVYSELKHLRALFASMQLKGWTTSQDGHQALDNHINNTHEEDRQQVLKLWAAISEYDRYRELVRQLQRHEAYDTIRQVITAFNTSPALLATYRQQSYAVVDGYSPLPGSLYHTLLDLLTGPTDDQSSLTLLPREALPWLEMPLLSTSLWQQLLHLLEYLAIEHDMPAGGEEWLFELLHTAWFNIPHREIALLTIEAADRQYTPHKTTLRRLLYEKVHAPVRELFAPPITEGLIVASRTIEQLIPLVSTMPLPAFLDTALRETGIRSWAARQPDSDSLLYTIEAFRQLVATDHSRHPQRSLQQFVQLVRLTEQETPFPGITTILPDQTHWTLRHLNTVLNGLRLTDELPAPSLSETVAAPQTIRIERLPEDVETRLVQRFVMNASALNHYLYCPLEFYFRNILRIPSSLHEAAEFGSAVHYALEQLFRKMQADHEAFPSTAILLADFEEYMHSHRASFTQEQFDRRLSYGHDILPAYYEQYVRSWNTIVAVERSIRNVSLNGVPLKGKIDKLEFDGRAVNIVDYKTGDPIRSKSRLLPPSADLPEGGSYWRQAIFYAILVSNQQQRNWQVQSAEIDFIEPDDSLRYHKVKIFLPPEAITTVTQQITNTWARIMARDFYTGCGKPSCHWCRFVKSGGG